MNSSFIQLEKNPIDDEYVSLLHDIHGEDIVRHLYRGGIIRAKNSAQVLFKEIAVMNANSLSFRIGIAEFQ